jgi:uncharacterized membrane protein
MYLQYLSLLIMLVSASFLITDNDLHNYKNIMGVMVVARAFNKDI